MFRKSYSAVDLVYELFGLSSEPCPKPGIILICTEGKMGAVEAQRGIVGVMTGVKKLGLKISILTSLTSALWFLRHL